MRRTLRSQEGASESLVLARHCPLASVPWAETNLKWLEERLVSGISENSNRQLLEEFFSNQRSTWGSLVRRNRASRREGLRRGRRCIDKRMILSLEML